MLNFLEHQIQLIDKDHHLKKHLGFAFLLFYFILFIKTILTKKDKNKKDKNIMKQHS